MENALIIFVRNLEKGNVKRRLAKSLGDDKSLEVYKYLLQKTKEVVYFCKCNLFVFYSDYIYLNDIFDDALFSKHIQEGDDLGERMTTAFKKVFDFGCKNVCIIGSDCYELKTQIIEDAFEELNKNDVVIGPARDGGYYLLGMKKLHTDLFINKFWGTSTVFEDTSQSISDLRLTYTQLPVLNDIDTLDDLLETDILARIKEDM